MPKIIAKLYFHLPDGSALEAVVPGYPVLIGKAPGNDIVIPDSGISRQHASVRMQNGQYVISDLGSLNGIFINGKKVGPDEARPLNNGDKLQMGRVKAVFSIEEVPTGSIQSDVYSTHVDTEPKTPATQPPAAQVERKPAQPQLPPAQPAQPAPPVAPLALKYKVAQTGELVFPKPANATPKEVAPRVTLDGRYELLDRLRTDDTGTVYSAKRILIGDVVSVRIIKPELVNDTVAVERFRRQAQVAARVKHPNSVQFYDFGYTNEGAAYIVEEALRGRTLRDLILKERGLSLPRVVSIVNQIAGAVHTANQYGIVLRDLKPETIFVEPGPDGRELIKVGGYGLAKVDQSISKGVQLTGPLGVYGTPQYMAPEQWNNRQLDSRTDVYALGVIIFELLTGAPPYNADNPLYISQLHLTAPIPDLSDYGRPDIDEDVAAVITRSLAKEPNRRQPTTLDLARELEAVSGNDGGVFGRALNRLTGVLPIAPMIVQSAPAAMSAGEVEMPSVVAQAEEKGSGAFNPTVLALMAEAFFSRLSSGLIKTAVPLYALLVFGLDITEVMALVLIQNVVPLLLRSFFGTMADKYGKKPVFLISLTVRTVVGVLYSFANLPLLYAVSLVRGLADSAKGPSASAMIADATDEKNIAQAYSWYTTTKSTSGGIGEALAAFALNALLVVFVGQQTITANLAILDKTNSKGAPIEQYFGKPDEIVQGLISVKGEPVRVVRTETRTIALKDVPVEDLPRVVAATPLRQTLNVIFWLATLFSLFSLVLVMVFIKEKKKEKKEKKKDKEKVVANALDAPQLQPNVYAFAFLGAALTAPAYMVTGEFFTLLAVKSNVTAGQLSGIKLFAETLVPLFFGPFFGWVADRIGAGKVIALRSIANLITSVLFWKVPSFAGTALLGTMMGLARAVDEIGKAAFKPTWGAIAAKVSSYNLSSRSKTMGILEGGVDASDLIFPQLAGILLAKLGIGPLMIVRAIMAIISEIYGHFLMKKYKI